jgi:hypothetical protein
MHSRLRSDRQVMISDLLPTACTSPRYIANAVLVAVSRILTL